MTRRRALQVVVVAAALVVIVLPAVAAAAATMVTVTPDTGLSGGQDVAVVASGLTPGDLAGWCEGVSAPGPATTANCGSNTTFTQTVDAAGTISGTFRLQRFIFVPNLAQWVDCTNTTETCVMGAADAADIAGTAASTPITFAAPPPPPATRGTIQLSAVAGGGVVVTGAGFRPGAAIDVFQCATGADLPSGCGFAKATPTSDASGSFQVTVPSDTSVQPAGGTTVNCVPFESQPCSIVVAEAADFPGTFVGAPLPVPPPPIPRVVPSATTGAEGDSGTTVLNVPVSLSEPTTQTVTVQWNTEFLPGGRPDQADPATDYTPASGTVTFAPGQTPATVPIVVNGDTLVEPDEYIVVSFHDPTNAVMGGYWGLGLAFINNDDHARIVPGVASPVVEGDTGTTTMNVPVTLSNPSTQTITAQYNTLQVAGDRPDQAVPGVDYVPTSGTVTFAPGETATTVPITVIGDTLVEPDEYVVVSFHDATNAAIGGYWGLDIGFITNDD